MSFNMQDDRHLTLKTTLGSIGNVAIGSLAYSSDDAMLAGTSVGGDASVIIWNLASGRIKSVLCGHEGPTVGSIFLPDNKLASAGQDGTVRLWDVSQGLGLRTLASPSTSPPCTDILGLSGSA